MRERERKRENKRKGEGPRPIWILRKAGERRSAVDCTGYCHCKEDGEDVMAAAAARKIDGVVGSGVWGVSAHGLAMERRR